MYGMDTISCGATLAWAMDCFEHGLIGLEDTGGIELRFGNEQAMVQLVESIAHRTGFGDLLAEGSARAAEKLGHGTADLVVAVKKQEMPAHMPQMKPGLGLVYAVNPFGADHQSSEHDPAYNFHPEQAKQLGLDKPQPELSLNEEVVKYAYITQCLYACLDSLDICQFVFGAGWQLYDPDQLVETVRSITGWDVSIAELLKTGEKRINLMRLFNLHAGVDSSADQLPKKIFQALTGGKTDGLSLNPAEFEQARRAYYILAGWDAETGIPSREKLESLGITWACESGSAV
jgi:aldehyde:ferredoxin oxidoreductase